MSANPTDPTSIIPSAPPPGLNYLAAIRPSLNMLLIGATWSSALVPLLLALFLFSTKQLRRTPIFILNVISILMGLGLGILNYYMEVTAIMSPDVPVSQSCFIAFGVLICLVPFLVESILVVRVLSVYPPRTISRRTAAAVYLPIICFKAARFINYALFWHAWFPTLGSGGNPVVLSQQAWNRPFQKIDWFLQVFDNGYLSALFLWRLHSGRKQNGRVESHLKRSSYSSLVNSLFWIAVSNFVFPVLLSVAQLIFAFQDHNYLDGSYVLFTNAYVEIIGVLLATVWSAGFKWADDNDTSRSTAGTGTTLSAARFASPNYTNKSHLTTAMNSPHYLSKVHDGGDLESGVELDTVHSQTDGMLKLGSGAL